MSNMSYCRFHNTAPDLQDCADNLYEPLSSDEARARKRLIRTAYEIVSQFLDEDGRLDEEAIKGLPVEDDKEER